MGIIDMFKGRKEAKEMKKAFERKKERAEKIVAYEYALDEITNAFNSVKAHLDKNADVKGAETLIEEPKAKAMERLAEMKTSIETEISKLQKQVTEMNQNKAWTARDAQEELMSLTSTINKLSAISEKIDKAAAQIEQAVVGKNSDKGQPGGPQ